MDEKIEKRAEVIDDVLKVLYFDEWIEVPLEDYDEITIISSGANAVTVSGIHKRTLRKDCIKVYIPNTSSGRKEVSLEQYLKEVRKLASLKNPNIVTVYDAFDIEYIHVVTMEYIDGITLKNWIHNHKCYSRVQDKIDRVLMTKKILETILFYQEKGIIHGDLHWNNILIDERDEIHIIDFGTSHFSKEGQSQERESFFVYDLVRKILGKDLFNEHYFTVKCQNKLRKCRTLDENDVQTKYPILVTRTMLAYVKAKDFLFQLPTNNLRPPNLIPMCEAITQGIYIDFDFVINDIFYEIEQKVDINIIAYIISENIQEHTIPETWCMPVELLEHINEDLIEVYYELSMQTKGKCIVGQFSRQNICHFIMNLC